MIDEQQNEGRYLTGIHASDTGQLEVLLGQAHAFGPVGDVALAHFPALLILDYAEHPKGPVLACTHSQLDGPVNKRSTQCFSHWIAGQMESPACRRHIKRSYTSRGAVTLK